ncbi:hypothetical protein D3C78_1630290 [compost metagenome]
MVKPRWIASIDPLLKLQDIVKRSFFVVLVVNVAVYVGKRRKLAFIILDFLVFKVIVNGSSRFRRINGGLTCGCLQDGIYRSLGLGFCLVPLRWNI